MYAVQGDPLSKRWEKDIELNEVRPFIEYLKDNYPNEFIYGTEIHHYLGKDVLTIFKGNSEDFSFIPNGKIAQSLIDDNFDQIYNDFISSKEK